MQSRRTTRQLAVILHADGASSTELVRLNEALAHERIRDAFRRLSAFVAAYGGTTHELRGDALLAEFPRASDAVCAALAFQAANVRHNEGLDEEISPEIRAGISLGEVIVADDTLTGPDVVLAQRLEQLAEPGAVCVSEAAYQSIPRRLPFDFDDLGEREVKGFDEPVRAYRVAVRPGAAIPDAEGQVTVEPATRVTSKRWWLSGLAATVLLFAVGLIAWLQPGPEREAADDQQSPSVALPEKPSIAVLPFDNLSADPQQEYFVDGMTEDLITDLSKVAGLFVIARNSSFVYKGKAVDVKRVGRELGVRYLLEGSVRRAGDIVRINAQLIDAATGGHLWSDRYDGAFGNVFALQDSVTRKIVSVLAVQLGVQDSARVVRHETENAAAYDEFLAGWQHYRRQTPGDFARAIPHFQRAVELDPEYGRAYAALAATYWYAAKRFWAHAFGFVSLHDSSFEAERFLAQAMRHPTPLAHHVASDMLSMRDLHDEAIAEAKKALELDPNDADGYVALGAALTLGGRPEEALEVVQRGMRLNPHFPPHYLYELGMARFGLGHLEDAATAFERALALNAHDHYPQRLLLATYGLLGRKADAARLIETAEREDPRGRFGTTFDPLTVRSSTYWIRFRRLQDAERFADGLRRSGLPD